jgi:Family of unknown function (DUF6481)
LVRSRLAGRGRPSGLARRLLDRLPKQLRRLSDGGPGLVVDDHRRLSSSGRPSLVAAILLGLPVTEQRLAMAFAALLLTPFRERRFACILSNSAYFTVSSPCGPHQKHQHYLMSNRSEPNLEERLKHASEAKNLMLAKFKMSLVEGPAAIERRQQRQAIAAARAERAAQREEARQRQEHELAKQAEIAAQAAADAARAAADEAAREVAEQAERNALLEVEQKATRDARYAARKAAKKKRQRGY